MQFKFAGLGKVRAIALLLVALFSNALSAASIAQSISCGGSSLRHDWDVNTWPGGSLSNSYTTSGETLSVAITGDTGFFLPDTASAPLTTNFDTGGLSPAEDSLELYVDHPFSSNTITVTADIGVSGIGVEELQFSMFDVDLAAAGFQDEVTVTGSINGTPVTPTLVGSVANSVSGNVATGTTDADSATADGTVLVTFSSPIDQFVISYTNGPSAPADPSQQAISIHDIFTCPRLLPDISASKTVAVFDPLSEGLHNIPGNDVIYTISASNSGTGPTGLDSIVLIDALPSELTFYNGDIDDGGPETEPVAFSQTNSPSLSLTYVNDVGYSNAATKPANFAACTYTPSAGYDPNVTFICINPKGQLEAGSPNPSFQIQFRSRIN